MKIKLAKIYMKKADATMFINEQPSGGFEWKFLDYKPDDIENYDELYIYIGMVKEQGE